MRGAALLVKLWVCGSDCAGFAMCAAWFGLTFGLHIPKSGQIRGLVARIEVTGTRILNAEARIPLADVNFGVAGARMLLAGARI